MQVWVLTEETNTGDSEHDTVVVSVHATEAGAETAMEAAIAEAQSHGKVVYGLEDDKLENDVYAGDWDVDFEVHAYEVQP